MRTSFRLAAVILVCAAALSASGCTPNPPDPKPSASATGNPLFASDEEALAAAEEAYAAYVAVVDAVLQRGGTAAEELANVAQGDALIQADEDARDFLRGGLHTVGSTQVRSVQLQEFAESAGGAGVIVIAYVCEDASAVDLVDSAGVSQVKPGRVTLTPFEVSFEESDGSAKLSVSSRTLWSESGPCD